jgi:hypothetical protein
VSWKSSGYQLRDVRKVGLKATPGGREETQLTFPWDVSAIIGRGRRLVEMLHEGRFDPLMTNREVRDWSRKVVNAG